MAGVDKTELIKKGGTELYQGVGTELYHLTEKIHNERLRGGYRIVPPLYGVIMHGTELYLH